MMLLCRICRFPISSVKATPEAEGEIIQGMMKHMDSHPKHAREFAQDIAAAVTVLTSYMLMQRHVIIPDDENKMLDFYDQTEKGLIELFGLLQPTGPDTAS